MSRTIDQKVVEMRFDNRDFERNVSTTMSTLDKLKNSLNLTGASKGLENVSHAANSVDMSGLQYGIETVRSKFSALEVMGITALANITNSAVNAGKRIAKALTIDPIMTGFSEYETKINAIQTIMSNTSSKGTTMDDVTKVLNELNTYADKTIYNFAEMTRNIGTFTAAGVGLEESASAIQGIANLAAASGSTSQQASTAMYQLSQALAAGSVKLQDWNSVVNAGMGGQKFQEALKATAKEHGVAVDGMIEKAGSFRESLKDGWITADILNETLSKFTVEGAKKYSQSMMESGKWTKEQADALLKEAQAMEDAATKVKTFTQLWDTLKESAQSGWSQSWEIIIGNFEEAKSFLTEISDTIGGLIGASADARNKVLQGWKDLGGRTAIIDSIRNAFEAVMSVVKPIGEAFREIFPPITAKQLVSFSEGLKKLTEKLKLSDEMADKLKRTFKGLFSIVDFFRKILTAVAKGIGSLFGSGAVSGVLDLILTLTAAIGDVFTTLNSGVNFNSLTKIFTGISDIIAGVIHGLTGFGDSLSGIGKAVSDIIGGIFKAFKSAFSWITDNISFGDILAGLVGGGVFLTVKKFIGLLDKLKEVAGKGILGMIFGVKDGGGGGKLGFVKKFSEVLDSVNETLGAFTNGIKIGSLLAIAGAIAILSGALKNISGINAVDITKSLLAIGIMFTMLTTSFKSISGTLDVFGGKGIIKSGIALMMMAKAIGILADAMKEMSGLSFKEIVKGLVGIGSSMAVLTLGLKAINGVKIKVTTLLSITVLADAIKKLAGSLSDFATMSWSEIKRGLTAMAGALAEFVITLKVLDKVGSFKTIAGSIALSIATESLDEISSGLKKLGELSWGEIKRGLTAMGGALTELVSAVSITGKLAGFSGILGAVAIVTLSKSLGDIAEALLDLGMLSWSEIGHGLVAMGGALAELAVISGVLGKLGGLSGLVGAATVVVAAKSLGDIAKALQKFGEMTWDEIKKGLTGMGLALGEVASITGILGKLAGFSGLFGAGAILIVVQGLGDIADALKKFGEMTWDQIKIGLTGMGLALGEIALITGVLGALGGLPSLIGAGAILMAVQGLGDIADALKKFGEMSWDEIGRGLTAMAGALGELALGGFLNTLSIIGSASIAKVAEPLGILADSVKKWADVVIPEYLGIQLALLANGIQAFTFSGFGASAISEVAAPLGTLADSVKKWTNIIVPENIPTQLSILADGIKKFTFGGMGASAISEVAGPLGILADSVKKWSGVVVPENIPTQLSSLADGIKAFSFAFMGGWSLDIITGPLGKLADSVKKWSGVVVPENIADQLKDLADGVNAFSFAFIGGWSLEAVTGPLGKLADSIKKWNGVTIPSGLGDKIKELAGSLKSFANIGDVSSGISGVTSLSSSISKLAKVNFESISSGLKNFSTSMTSLATSSKSISGVGTSIVTNILKPINEAGSKFKTAGTKMVEELVRGMKATASVKTAGTTLAKEAAKGASSQTTAFRNAGRDVVEGFANGIKANTWLAEAKAKAMAQAAVRAAKKQLDVHSPSKVFYKIGDFTGLGFVNALGDYASKSYDAGSEMASSARLGLSEAIGKVKDFISGDMDVQPTIRPVLDLSNVKSGAGAINSMFNTNPSVGLLSNVGAINTMMNRRQNGNDDVVSAINKLGKKLGNIGNTTYNVNGVNTNGDGNVESAIETLVRAIRIEGRV